MKTLIVYSTISGNTKAVCERIYNALNVEKEIINVSGGIDSAVVAYLIKEAFPDNSMGVIMNIKSNPQDKIDGMKVIDGCGIDYLEFDLDQPQVDILNMVTDKLRDKGLYREESLKMTELGCQQFTQ